MLDKFFRLIGAVFTGIVAIIICLILLSAFPKFTGFRLLVVKSGSMEPNINTGSMILVKSAKIYRVGDIVTFSNINPKKDPITHRIVSIDEGFYRTKGDANKDADERVVLKNEILGKMHLAVPVLGFVLNAAKKPIGFILIIGLPVLLFLIEQARAIYEEYKKQKQKNSIE